VEAFKFPCLEAYQRDNTILGITRCLRPDIAHDLAPPLALTDGDANDQPAVGEEMESRPCSLLDAVDGVSDVVSSSSSSSDSEEFEEYDPKDPRWLDPDDRPDLDAAPSGLNSPERGRVRTIRGEGSSDAKPPPKESPAKHPPSKGKTGTKKQPEAAW
jgi:hypothetical protein